MKLPDRVLEALAEMVVGDNAQFPYRSSSSITRFFERCELSYVHDGSTRKWWTKNVLSQLNLEPGQSTDLLSDSLLCVIDEMFDPIDFENSKKNIGDALAALNKLFSRQGLVAHLDGNGRCHLRNSGTNTRSTEEAELQVRSLSRRYYSSRKRPGNLSLDELYDKLQAVYLLFREKDYFKELAGITKSSIPSAIEYEARIGLNFQPFPITKWSAEDVTEDHVFDTLEFLYDRVSQPGEYGYVASETGFSYNDYLNYDAKAGQEEFRTRANAFLADYKSGFEITEKGVVVALGTHGLQHILDAEIVPYDEANVDSKVRGAIEKWRDRHATPESRREAIP